MTGPKMSLDKVLIIDSVRFDGLLLFKGRLQLGDNGFDWRVEIKG